MPLEEHRSTPDGQSQFSTAWGLHQVLVRREGEREWEGGKRSSERRRIRGRDGRKDEMVSCTLSLSVQKALNFLSNDCGLVHNNVNISSVFVDVAGEWKLGGVEFMTPFSDSAAAGPAGKILQGLRKYDPPETSKSAASRRAEKW